MRRRRIAHHGGVSLGVQLLAEGCIRIEIHFQFRCLVPERSKRALKAAASGIELSANALAVLPESGPKYFYLLLGLQT